MGKGVIQPGAEKTLARITCTKSKAEISFGLQLKHPKGSEANISVRLLSSLL